MVPEGYKLVFKPLFCTKYATERMRFGVHFDKFNCKQALALHSRNKYSVDFQKHIYHREDDISLLL